MKFKILLSSVYITVLFFTTACGHQSSSSEENARLTEPNVTEEIYFDKLMEFHIEHQKWNAVFVLTAYERPYYGHFEYIFLNQSDELWAALDYSTTHIVGSEHGNVTPDEKEKMLNALNILSRGSNIIIPEDKTLITISYYADGVTDVFSCQNSNCPSEVCKIYEVANTVAERSGKTYHAQFNCPITSTEK